MVIGGNNYTGLQAVNLKGSGGIRLGGFDANAGTLYLNSASLENPRQWGLPDKTGVFAIMGSFVVQLPAIAATTNFITTIATVSGIRAEDAVSVTMNGGTSAGYGDLGLATSGATAKILFTARPGNGNITLGFLNLGVATGYTEHVMSYLAVR